MRSASESDIKEDKALLYFPPKINPKKAAFLRLDKEKIAFIEKELKNPQNPIIIQYIKERLNGNPYGRYSKELFDCPCGLIYGKKGLYAIYNEDDEQFEAAPAGGFGKIKLAIHVRTYECLILKTQVIKSPLRSLNENYKNEHAILSTLELTEEPIMQRWSSKDPDTLKVFFLMKYLKGQDLFDLISQKINKNNPMSQWPDLFWLHVCIRITEALIKIRKKNILHRDIKFENILFDTANDEAHIIDFGNSQDTTSKLIIRYPKVFSPGLNAPETFYSIYNDKSEIFAFSNILEAFLLNNIPCAIIQGKKPSFYAPPKFEQFAKTTIFGHDKNVAPFLKSMRHSNAHERPSLPKVLEFLQKTFQKYASDPEHKSEVDSIQQILSENHKEEITRLEKVNKVLETMAFTEKSTPIKLYSIFKSLMTHSKNFQNKPWTYNMS